MTNTEFGTLTLQLFLLIALAQLLGYWFTKLRQPKAIMRTRYMSIMILTVVVAFSVLYFTRWGHEVWILIAIVFSLLSATEFFCQAQFPNVESLVFQNRLLGILYLGLSIASYIMLSRV